jgi:hypothetical protein
MTDTLDAAACQDAATIAADGLPHPLQDATPQVNQK